MTAKIVKQSNPLVQQILNSLDGRKAQEIVCLDLRKNDDAIVDYFIICHGDSSTQVNAIAGNLEKDILENLQIRPYHVEGERSASWVIVDYIDVVVHIFHREIRSYYQLEELWSDAISTRPSASSKSILN